MSERYENYMKFAKAVARVRGFIIRNRILLITIGAVAVTTLGAYIGTKGIIMEDPATVAAIEGFKFEYGQPIEATCSGFLSDAKYQFSPAEEENWSYAIPENVGQYKMRAVSQSSFGERYGDTHYFEIKPKKAAVFVPVRELKFEEEPHFSIDGLLSGHRLSQTKWHYDDNFTLTPNLVVDAVTVLNAAGADVTANYDIDFPAGEEAKMTIAPRPIAISLAKETLLYNGAEQTFAGIYSIKEGELAEGDVLCQDPVKALHAGNYSHGGFTVEDAEGRDKTIFYDIKTENPEAYSILVKPITISSPNVAKIYDGKGFSLEDRGIVTALDPSGAPTPDAFAYEFKNDLSDDYAPGEYENVYEYTLGNATDYNVTSKPGTLSIAKRDLRVRIDGEWTYNGNAFAADAFDNAGFLKDDYYGFTDDTSLADGDVLRIKCEGEVYGEKTFTASILHGKADVTATCYNLVVDGGIVTKKASLTLAGQDNSYVYDGKPHGLECKITGAQGSDKITLNEEFAKASITDVGEISLTPSVSAIKNAANEDRSMYYTVSQAAAKTTITKRPVSIRLFPDYEYVGTTIDYSLAESQYEFLDGTTLAEGHRIEIEGQRDALFPLPNAQPLEPAFTYRVYDEKDVDVTKNYDITLTDQSTKRLHKLTLSDAAAKNTFVYDGTMHTLDFKAEGELDADNYGYSFEYNTITEPGKVSSTPHLFSALNKATGEETIRYYDVDTEEISITVTKRPVEITCHPSRTFVGSVSDMVNAEGTQTLLSSEYSIASGEYSGLVGSDYVEIRTQKNIFALQGEEKPSYTCSFFHGDGSVADNCYSVSFVDDGFEAVKDPTSFDFVFSSTATNEMEKVYDGTYETPLLTWNDDGSYGGFAKEPASTFASWKPDVGVYEASVPAENFTLYDAYGVQANDYYTLKNAGENITAKLTISKRPIVFSVKGREGIPEIDISSGSLVSGHSYDWEYREDGDSYTYAIKIKDQYAKDVTSNYDITVNYDSFADQALTLTAQNVSYQYQGIDHMGYVTVSGLRAGDEIQYVKGHAPSDFHWMYAGSGTYEPQVSKIVNAAGKDVTSTYAITTVPGTWEIVPAPVSMTLSGLRVYDGTLFSATPLETGSELNYITYLPDGLGGRMPSIYNALFGSDTLTVSPKDETIFVEDVDPQYTIQITGWDGSKWVDFSNNYAIAPADFDASGFGFQKADLYVSGHVEVFRYDAQDHTPQEPIANGLRGNDTLSDYVYDPEDPSVNNIHDEHNGKIDYTISDAVIKNGNSDRSKYYNVYYTGGSIEIDANIVIDLGTHYGVHTGEEQNIDEFLDRENVGAITPELPAGFTFKKSDLKFLGTVKDHGFNAFSLANLDLSSVHILDPKGNDVSENFVITSVTGGVYLETATLTVSAIGETKTYDGANFKVTIQYALTIESGNDITWGPKSYVATIEYHGEHSRSGVYELDIFGSEFEIHFYGEVHGGDAKAKDAELVEIDKSLYTIAEGMITAAVINARALAIETDSIKEYTGFTIDFGKLRITGGSLAKGDVIEATKPASRSFSEATTCNNGPDVGWSYVIKNSNGEDVTSCYAVTENWGSIVITEWEDW